MLKKISLLNKKLEESQTIFIYRFISLLITSIFYLFNNTEHEIGRKLFIIGCISISAVILSYLYIKFKDSKRSIIVLLFIETVGNSIILIPSGGVNSPFIWYSLNTILLSAVFFKGIYSWINLLVYLLNYYVISYFFTESNLNFIELIKNEPNLILSFIMIIAFIQAWSIFIENTKDKNLKLEEVNAQLELSNETILESMDHIKALYQLFNILSNQGNREGLIKLLFEHIKNITKTNTVFYYDISSEKSKMHYEGDSELLKSLGRNIKEGLQYILEYKIPKEITISNKRFVIIIVESNYTGYGILGFEVTSCKESIVYENNINQIKFLSELISLSFERFYLEDVNDKLLITEEQNRIANEVHDSVLQRLFGMSLGIFSLIKKLDKYSTEELENELNLIRKSADTAMKELRNKIYGLSWKKSGSNSFIKDINSYIEDIKRFNAINIPFSIQGNNELLSLEQKKALYRIICEGIGNAVRHGKAKNIEVSLEISASNSILNIVDDGIGFDINMANKEKTNGLGILNLYQLTESLHGEISIDSNLGNYTMIEVIIPNNLFTLKKEESTL